MSEEQKPMITIPVDIVENIAMNMSYICSTLDFWHTKKEWPINLIYDCLD